MRGAVKVGETEYVYDGLQWTGPGENTVMRLNHEFTADTITGGGEDPNLVLQSAAEELGGEVVEWVED